MTVALTGLNFDVAIEATRKTKLHFIVLLLNLRLWISYTNDITYDTNNITAIGTLVK